MTARWIAATVPPAADELVLAGHPLRLAQLLALRGISEPAVVGSYLSPRREDLGDPSRIPGFDAAVERLDRAVGRGERVVVLGDYDVDGVTATALMAATLRACGVTVETLLPRRDGEGYGLQALHARRAAELGATLLVSVDSGTNAFDAAREACRLGVELLVVDHHLPESDALEGAIVVNPKLGSSATAETPIAANASARELTAAGLALKLAAALLARRGREVPWEALLRVAALGTIADVAPLVGENRVIASLGLEALANARSPGLRALMEVAAVRAPVSASEVAFRLAPRINAPGRLASADAALELLLTRDERRARALAAELHELNAERQRIEESLLAGARADLAARCAGGPPPIVVAWRAGWHRGVVGIAAARLARETNRPTILLALDGGLAVGSGRSTEGIALHEFLQPWAARMERFGGHAQAVGMTVRDDRLEALRGEWEEAAAAWTPRLSERVRRYDLDLELAEVGGELLSLVERLEPFGAGNPEPLFRFRACRLAAAPREFGRGHLQLSVVPTAARAAGGSTGAPVSVVAWRGREQALDLEGSFELLAAIERDRPRGVRLRLVDQRRTPSAP